LAVRRATYFELGHYPAVVCTAATRQRWYNRSSRSHPHHRDGQEVCGQKGTDAP
jgi:hypothetical protein